LSRASLAYAARRARELGLRNVQFIQGDILELGRLNRRFDVIECAGVLHHMHDPLAGWRVLRGLLNSGGKMKIGLYSETGRRAITAARELISERGYGSDAQGMRMARSQILSLTSGHPARRVAEYQDFYSLSGCRDLLFHVQEHRYDLRDIARMLEALELVFLGFEFETMEVLAQYRREFPEDPANSLESWALFETRHPDTFRNMYQFWVSLPS
jgi:SAM-dependent methyltransferase